MRGSSAGERGQLNRQLVFGPVQAHGARSPVSRNARRYTDPVPLTSLTHLERVVSNVRVDATLSAAEVESAGARCLQSSTDDLLGLAADVRVREAAIGAIRKFGIAPGPHTRLREELESRLASHLNLESAALMADLTLLGALPGRVAAEGRTARRVDVIASEVLSLETADAPIGRLFVTDALHPFEGDLAPLPRLLEQAQREQSTVISIEAQGLGVLGASGGGVAEHLGIAGQGDLHLLWLGALGGQGWVVAGRRPLVAAVKAFTSAAPALPTVAATLRALEILHSEPQRRSRAFDVAQRVINAFRHRGLDTGPCVTPWVPVWLGDEALTEQWLRALLEAGIATRALLAGHRSRLLFSVAATISDAQLDTLLEGVDRVSRKLPAPDSTYPRAQVTVSRPGSFVMAAPCAPKWVEFDAPEAVEEPETTTLPRTLSNRVFDAVETLTWRAANLRTARLPGTDALRALIDRTRSRKP